MGRSQDRAHSESLALSGADRDWMTAKTIAIRLGMAKEWRRVAWALQRLEDKRLVERVPLPMKDGEGKMRMVNHYRLIQGAAGFLPGVVKRIL